MIPSSVNKLEDSEKFIVIIKRHSGEREHNHKAHQLNEIHGTIKLMMINNAIMRQEMIDTKE